MIYIQRDKLNIITIPEKVESISFDKFECLINRPTNVIYVELNSKIYGMISMDDINTAYLSGKNVVAIKKKFFRELPGNYIHTLNLFRNNINVSNIPIITKDNFLLGEYQRYDDLIGIFHEKTNFKNKYAKAFFSNYNYIAMIKPCDIFESKKEYFNKMKTLLEENNVRLIIINRNDILNYISKIDFLLFTDEDELRGTNTFFKIFHQKNLDRYKLKTLTYKELEIKLQDSIIYTIGQLVLEKIKNSGAYVLTFNYYDIENDYWKNFNKEIEEKYSKIGEIKNPKLHPAFFKDFFYKKFNDNYAKEILGLCFEEKIIDGIPFLKDCKGKYLNIENGIRRTTNQPKEYEKTIYFFGPCIMIGNYSEDSQTIESFLQKKINIEGYKIRVINCGVWSDALSLIHKIIKTPLKSGDIVIANIINITFYNIPNVNIYEWFENNRISSKWVTDGPIHCNYKVNEMYANELYQFLLPELLKKNNQNNLIKLNSQILIDTYIEQYFFKFNKSLYKNIGAIVMNANPFTNGHKYLIEEALKIVDFLIIFVVEEDKSIFSFDTRLACVEEATKKIHNTMVVPSGNFIISQRTFPEYFVKIIAEDIEKNMKYDIEIFSKYIAKKLNIKYRFVGEELNDEVTAKYNKKMKEILPKYDIELIEIPRKKINEKIISASTVRKYLEENKIENLQEMIPEETKKILFYSNYPEI